MRANSKLYQLLTAALALLAVSAASIAQLRNDKVPSGTLIVRGAWSSASDSTTPVPEGGALLRGTYRNDYFGLTYTLPDQWTERFSGPPPSDSGYYVLAQVEPVDEPGGTISAHLLIAAQDLFFSLTPAGNALEQLNYARDRLPPSYVVDTPPTQVSIANHAFIRLDYESRVSGLHWRILATEIRCHVVQFIFTSRDLKLIDKLSGVMQSMTLSSSDTAPVCLKNYASQQNRIAGENPVLTSSRFNPIPVRIAIDTDGKVKHIHLLSAFSEQAATIVDALAQWQFKPHVVDGRPVEVETGIMLGGSSGSGI